jgi:hypothetical protein
MKARRQARAGPRALALVLGVLCAALGVPPAIACEPHLKAAGVQKLEGRRYAIAWRAVPAIHVGEFFTLDVAVCAREGQPRPATLRVDAVMPDHGHGMNYRASVRPQGPDRFVVEGLLWHMPGRWELRFDVNAGADRESLSTELLLD